MPKLDKRVRFLELLGGLAEMVATAYPNFRLSKIMIQLYENALAQHGYDRLCAALEQIVLSRKSRDPFPSVAEVAAVINPQLDPAHEAIEAANRVWAAVGKFGYTNPQGAEEYIGQLGWKVVERYGGWGAVCQESNYSDAGVIKAQMRETAKAIYGRHKAGVGDTKPALPGPNTGFTQIADMTKQIAERLKPKGGE